MLLRLFASIHSMLRTSDTNGWLSLPFFGAAELGYWFTIQQKRELHFSKSIFMPFLLLRLGQPYPSVQFNSDFDLLRFRVRILQPLASLQQNRELQFFKKYFHALFTLEIGATLTIDARRHIKIGSISEEWIGTIFV